MRRQGMRHFVSAVIVACGTILLLGPANAIIVSVEPDDFVSGTDLTHVSSHVTLTTTQGAAVYAAPIAGDGQTLPTGASEIAPFHSNVFSSAANQNSEWSAWPDLSGANVDSFDPLEWAKESQGLLLTFLRPATYVSLLGLELFPDAGWGGDDPLRWWLYDSTGALIHTGYEDTIPADGSIGHNPDFDFDYSYWLMEFTHPDIMYVVVGGESEPTTLDRLVFVTDIPEPDTLILALVGMSGLLFVRRRRQVVGLPQ